MKSFGTSAWLLFIIALTASAAEPKLADCPPPPPGFPKFKVQEIATDLKIGYAVHICDVNGDGKPDIVVVDQHRVVWYENPTWKMHTILTGKTKPDNVCICSVMFEGKICFVLGAGWKPFDTKTPGTLQWLRRGKSLDDEWEMFPIPCEEPTVHRVKAIDIDNSGKPSVVMAPLMGRDSTKEKNWLDGRPVCIQSWKVPKEPTKAANWKQEMLLFPDQLHVVHNFTSIPTDTGIVIATASYEGIVSFLTPPKNEPWYLVPISKGDQSNPKDNRGSSEISIGNAINKTHFIATIEPWHGNQVVMYTEGKTGGFARHVIDDHLRWGHAVAFADFDGDKIDELVVGTRDNPDPKLGDTFTEKCGVRLYRATDAKGEKWERYILEDGGVAVEDLAVADLNGDGKPDIIAVGRKTGNCRIYWNQGK